MTKQTHYLFSYSIAFYFANKQKIYIIHLYFTSLQKYVDSEPQLQMTLLVPKKL